MTTDGRGGSIGGMGRWPIVVRRLLVGSVLVGALLVAAVMPLVGRGANDAARHDCLEQGPPEGRDLRRTVSLRAYRTWWNGELHCEWSG